MISLVIAADVIGNTVVAFSVKQERVAIIAMVLSAVVVVVLGGLMIVFAHFNPEPYLLAGRDLAKALQQKKGPVPTGPAALRGSPNPAPVSESKAQ